MNATLPSIKKPPQEIETQRLRIIRPSHELAQCLYDEIEKDRIRLGQFLPWVPFIQSVADEEKYISDVHKNWNETKAFAWSIFLKENSRFVGNIDFHAISSTHLRGEIGYWCVAQYEGQGLMTEALTSIEKTLFDCGFHRIAILCSTHNPRSSGIAKRLNYRHEGTMIEDSFIAGKWHSTEIYAKTKKT